MLTKPLVSIYIPTHNRRQLLERAIGSIVRQTYDNIELLIVNDASSDDTNVYLESLSCESIPIRLFENDEPKGACYSRNLAISHAKGEFITGLDDDDEFLPDRIAQFVDEYDDEYSFICTGFLWDYGKKMRSVDHSPMIVSLEKQLDYNYATNQIFVKTTRLLNIGGFDETFLACQDYDTWTRLIIKYGNAKRIRGVSYIIHRGDDVKRISASGNWLKGHEQFTNKFEYLMSSRNKNNQQFRRISADRNRYLLSIFISHLSSGLVVSKIRYFLSSNLTILASLRRKLIE